MFVVRVPGINGLGKTKGCERAGVEILKCLKEIYSNEEGKAINSDFLDLEEIHLDNNNLELTSKLIYENSKEAFERKPRTIFIGGDHSISYSIVRAFYDNCKREKKDPCLIIFDAHLDCMPAVSESEKYPTHRKWLRKILEIGFPPENILFIGVRNSDERELKFLNEKRMRVISMDKLFEDLYDACEIIMEFVDKRPFYLSIDIDAVDPAYAPSVPHPEPGGLSSREIIYLIQRIKKIKTLRGVDLVEINPEKDSNHLTVKLGAKILAELL